MELYMRYAAEGIRCVLYLNHIAPFLFYSTICVGFALYNSNRDVSAQVRNHLAHVLCRQLKLTTEVRVKHASRWVHQDCPPWPFLCSKCFAIRKTNSCRCMVQIDFGFGEPACSCNDRSHDDGMERPLENGGSKYFGCCFVWVFGMYNHIFPIYSF